MPAPVLQFKRGNAGVAGTVPALRPGEPAISLNNFDFFIGIDTSVANNKFFGSHRYWGREDGTNSLRLNLVDRNGSNYIALKSPNTLAGIVTYTLPGTQGSVSSVLTNDGSGNLTWSSGSANPVFTGIATFSDTTDNTLGDTNTGSVQINGGLGIDKNVSIGGSLNVQGSITSSGAITGTISTATRATLVDTTGTSNNATYYVTFVDTSAGQTEETLRVGTALSLNASSGNVKSAGDLIAGSGYLASGNGTRAMYMFDTSGDVSFQGKVVANNFRSSTNASNTLTFSDLDASFARNLYVTGIATVNSNLIVGGDLYVNGTTTQVNTSTLTVEDRTIELGVVDGSAPSTSTTWDLGVLFNYYTDSAKKSAIVWEHTDGRFKLGSVISDSGGTGNNNPQITVSSFAALEISDLWINNSCTGGAQQVIGCVSSELQLQNITIDAGYF
jgi:hypothetical protein